MADLIIRGMEMPKSCMDCPLVVCLNTKDDCPISPLQEGHGRLIDADAFEDAFIRYYLSQERSNHLVFTPVEIKQRFADMIADFPTIIEADIEWKMKNCCCFSNTGSEEGGTDDGQTDIQR